MHEAWVFLVELRFKVHRGFITEDAGFIYRVVLLPALTSGQSLSKFGG